MKAIALIAVAGLASVATAGNTIAFTSFEEPGTATPITDNAVVGMGGEITGTGFSYAGGAEIGFQTFWRDTRGTGEGGPIDPPDSTDFIGVTDFTGTVGAYTDGVQGYQWNDADGAIDLVLNTIDASGFTGVELTFDLFVQDTSYESDDIFNVSVNGNTELALGEPDLEALGAGLVWATVTVDLSAYDGMMLDIVFTGDTNSGSENFYIDNLSVTGIPTPGSIAILGLGGLAAARRRR